MKKKNAILGVSLLLIICSISTGTAFGQAQENYVVYNLGGGFTQATVVDARRGFLGFNMFCGKMLTDYLCVGISASCDINSYRDIDDNNERMTVIPLLARLRLYYTTGELLQMYATVGAGVYNAVPHVNIHPIGDIWNSTIQPGGSIGFGVEYWFLLTMGVGLEFEYHMFPTEEDSMFSYFAARLNYTFIRF